MRSTRNSLAAVLLALALSAPAAAQLDLSWHTIDGGGGFSSGGGLELAGTIGQPDAGVLTGGSFTLTGGFWGGVSIAPDPCPGDTDGDNDVDLSDLAAVLADFGLTGAGLGGDVDADGDVDLTDLAIVLANFGVAC